MKRVEPDYRFHFGLAESLLRDDGFALHWSFAGGRRLEGPNSAHGSTIFHNLEVITRICGQSLQTRVMILAICAVGTLCCLREIRVIRPVLHTRAARGIPC